MAEDGEEKTGRDESALGKVINDVEENRVAVCRRHFLHFPRCPSPIPSSVWVPPANKLTSNRNNWHNWMSSAAAAAKKVEIILTRSFYKFFKPQTRNLHSRSLARCNLCDSMLETIDDDDVKSGMAASSCRIVAMAAHKKNNRENLYNKESEAEHNNSIQSFHHAISRIQDHLNEISRLVKHTRWWCWMRWRRRRRRRRWIQLLKLSSHRLRSSETWTSTTEDIFLHRLSIISASRSHLSRHHQLTHISTTPAKAARSSSRNRENGLERNRCAVAVFCYHHLSLSLTLGGQKRCEKE